MVRLIAQGIITVTIDINFPHKNSICAALRTVPAQVCIVNYLRVKLALSNVHTCNALTIALAIFCPMYA